MARKLVQKSISINASAERIWRVITEAQYNVVWLAALGRRKIAQTDWQKGSKAVFVDDDQTGLITRIRVARPFEKIRMQNVGMITNGVEDCESDEAVESREFFEQYLFTTDHDSVRMHVEVTVEDDFYNEVSDCWAKALEIIKELAESQSPTRVP
ncbi:SRPBCC family protein [Dyadobacter jiangsuensis]